MVKRIPSKINRKRPSRSQYFYGYIVAGILILLGIVGYFTIAGTSENMSSENRIKRDVNTYDVMMRNNAWTKRGELRDSGAKDPQTTRKINWLIAIQDIIALLPWENKYIANIHEKEVRDNPSLAEYRIVLINRFQPLRDVFDDAIGNPSNDNIARAISSLRAETQLIKNTINETQSKASQIGSTNAKVVTDSLDLLLRIMNDKDYE